MGLWPAVLLQSLVGIEDVRLAVTSQSILQRLDAERLLQPEADLAIMRRLDRLHLEFPFVPARGCCEACWLPRGARSAVVM